LTNKIKCDNIMALQKKKGFQWKNYFIYRGGIKYEK